MAQSQRLGTIYFKADRGSNSHEGMIRIKTDRIDDLFRSLMSIIHVFRQVYKIYYKILFQE